MSGLKFPKPRPAALERQDRRTRRETADERESRKVRHRSDGRCEIDVHGEGRCKRRAFQVHHMIGGWGKRARGPSLFAEHKQHACSTCHQQIGAHILTRVGGPVPRWTNRYTREV